MVSLTIDKGQISMQTRLEEKHDNERYFTGSIFEDTLLISLNHSSFFSPHSYSSSSSFASLSLSLVFNDD